MPITHYVSDVLGAALLLLTLPLVVELAVLTLASRFRQRNRSSAAATSSPIRLAVIIPAHNEEALIGTCVESLRVSAAGTETRIIAVAHNCSDRTADRAAKAGAEVVTYNNPQASGKGSALACGFDYVASQGVDAALVVDADSTVSSNLIGLVGEAFAKANGAEAVQCRYELESSSKRPVTQLTALAFRGFNVVRPIGRNRLGLSAGILGNGFAVRQEVLTQNPYNSLSVVEDLEYHIRLLLSGAKVQFLNDARVWSGVPPSQQGEATQRSRWEGGRANAAATWLGPLLRQLMRGRVRMVEPLLDLMCLPIGYAAFLLLFALCLPLEWLRVYALVAGIILTCHVLAAAWVGNDFAGDLRILARVPGYICWKLSMLPSIVRSSRTNAAWVRTERQPAIQTVMLEAAAEGNTSDAMEHALRIRSSLEVS
jgi:cellulose synthase/poly-beta-1,6-N-acetylglucosamine synthase-like glycosyltransferase